MATASPMWDFFIAHAGSDYEIAEQLYDELHLKARTFLDGRSLILGDDWDTILQQAQQSSRVTVVLISKKTPKAYYQREEIANAIAMARVDANAHRVVPIYVDLEDEPVDIPYGLRLKHGMRLSEVGGISDAGRKLLEIPGQLRSRAAASSRIESLTDGELAFLFVLQQTRLPLPIGVLTDVCQIDL